MSAPPRIAVLIPCRNEAVAIPRVVAAFRAALPDAAIYAYDNNSTDDTVALARAAGAIIGTEAQPGKGHVMRRMFADVQADIYVMVDGDDTYEAAAAPAMIDLLLDRQLDMVTAVRVTEAASAYRRGHRTGNTVLTGLVAYLFGARVTDMLSGYRVFSRRFVKSFPALSAGFETETELTVHALQLALPVGEIRAAYRERPAGSASKLRTFSDGLRILRLIVMLVKDERPLPFFSLCGAGLFVIGLGVGAGVVIEFWRTGLVPRLPTAIVAAALVALSFLSFACGLILDSVGRGRREMKRLAYLAHPAPSREKQEVLF
jgi:glycosyltransferase involved in cell wall biosynthesis